LSNHDERHDNSNSDDESKEVYVAKLIWPAKAKLLACCSLWPIQKNRQGEVKFTFNFAKCDKIFDKLLKNGNIKLPHTIPSIEELKRRVYCKWHDTNDCNVFCRQIQSIDYK
jgi:hypothetical protein